LGGADHQIHHLQVFIFEAFGVVTIFPGDDEEGIRQAYLAEGSPSKVGAISLQP
jgi:hypothetical protein